MLWLVVLIPTLAAAAAFVIPSRATGRWLLLAGALGHLAAVGALWAAPQPEAIDNEQWLAADELARLFLTITSVMFLAAAVYAVGYLKHEATHDSTQTEEGFLFTNEPQRVFVGCLLGFLATMSLVCLCHHLGLLWVAVEMTTLVSAPLIYFHRHPRSLEATWKYLLICSVGIAVAMLGNFSLAFAAKGSLTELTLGGLLSHAAELDPTWLKAAFLMLLVGYGTKMGLVPMHTWLPDAHSEAPSMVSALLSGALLNCAFLAILRAQRVLTAASLGAFGEQLLIIFGLLSMGVAAVMLIRQRDFKRLLAYSSIEHMGILALGVGLGGLAAGGALLHAVNHSVAKGLLFLVAGNLLATYGTKNVCEVSGVLRSRPLSGMLWVVGLLAITGSPPFGTFFSELVILRGALAQGHWLVAAGYLLSLGVIFAAMARVFLPMAFGQAANSPAGVPAVAPAREPAWSIAPPLMLAAMSLCLGLWVPAGMWDFLTSAARSLGGQP